VLKEDTMAPATLPVEPAPPDELDRHFSLPAIRHVPASQPLLWLRGGWQDLRRNKSLSVRYGLLFTIAGWSLLFFAAPRPYLFTAAVSGLMLVAPLLAAGLYEISRRQGEAMSTNFDESLSCWTRNGGSMALFGLVLALVAIAWERLSAILFALFYGGEIPTVGAFLNTVLLSGNYWGLVIAYVALGGLLAALVFAMSVISVPMLVDREVDVLTAIAMSLKAVRQNPAAMALWAALLVALMALGFATLLLGMIVLLPWAAYASWHAYRDLAQQ
jgi:uncharacterized membrane protein